MVTCPITFRTVGDKGFRAGGIKDLTDTFHFTRQAMEAIAAGGPLQGFFTYCVLHAYFTGMPKISPSAIV